MKVNLETIMNVEKTVIGEAGRVFDIHVRELKCLVDKNHIAMEEIRAL